MNTAYAVEADGNYKVSSIKKKKKPWFLKRWVINWVREDWEKESELKSSLRGSQANLISTDNSINSDQAIRFNVYHANGGRVVEVSKYDSLKDRSKRGLYVITNDQDFGREIDKIITMEALK